MMLSTGHGEIAAHSQKLFTGRSVHAASRGSYNTELIPTLEMARCP
jgi:hypothetical protein